MSMVSPNTMMEAAREMMLEGREPESKEDWVHIVRFLAANIHPEVVFAAMPVMRLLFNIPLTEDEVFTIVKLQVDAEQARRN